MMTMTKCPWCDKEFELENSVVRHSSRVHGKDRREFDLKTKYGGVVPKCKCGCGQDVNYNYHEKVFNTYVHMHQANDPAIRNKMIEAGRAAANDEHNRKKTSLRMKAWWNDPRNSDKHAELLKVWLPALHEGHRRASGTPEYRNQLRESMITRWAGGWGIRQRELLSSPENRERVSTATKEALAIDEIREKLSLLASNNQAKGIIAVNRSKRSWVFNPFTGADEHCDSSWEVKLLNEAIRRNVPIKRNRDIIIGYTDEVGHHHNYVPDFVTLSNMTIIEVKGRKTQRDELKLLSGLDYCRDNHVNFVVFDSLSRLTSDELWNSIT